jgi:hypothetical protein
LTGELEENDKIKRGPPIGATESKNAVKMKVMSKENLAEVPEINFNKIANPKYP